MLLNIFFVPSRHSHLTECALQPWETHTQPLLEVALDLVHGAGGTENHQGRRRGPTNLLARLLNVLIIKT